MKTPDCKCSYHPTTHPRWTRLLSPFLCHKTTITRIIRTEIVRLEAYLDQFLTMLPLSASFSFQDGATMCIYVHLKTTQPSTPGNPFFQLLLNQESWNSAYNFCLLKCDVPKSFGQTTSQHFTWWKSSQHLPLTHLQSIFFSTSI